jgi:hypothetical protein
VEHGLVAKQTSSQYCLFRIHRIHILFNNARILFNCIKQNPELCLTEERPEPLFVNITGAKESIPGNRLGQAGNRFLDSLKDLQIRAQFPSFPAWTSCTVEG